MNLVTIVHKDNEHYTYELFNDRFSAERFIGSFLRKWISSNTHIHVCSNWVNELNENLSRELVLKATDIFNKNQSKVFVDFNFIEVNK